jgi:type IV pilus assembly protein PilQ
MSFHKTTLSALSLMLLANPLFAEESFQRPLQVAQVENSVQLGQALRLEIAPGQEKETIVAFESTDIIQYTAFKLSNPLRLVLDIPNISPVELNALDIKQGVVESVRPVYFSEQKILRLEVIFSAAADYDIEKPDGKNLRIKIQAAAKEKTATAQIPAETVQTASVSATAVNVVQEIQPASPEVTNPVMQDMGKTPIKDTSGIATADETNVEDPCDALLKGDKEKISLDFQGASLDNLFRLFADVSGFNLVVAPNVNGTVNIRVNNVPWNMAFDLVLRNNGLGRECFGNNTIRVATFATLAAEEATRNEAGRNKNAADLSKRLSQEVTTEVVRINYANLDDMVRNLNLLISNLYSQANPERASVAVDARTNTLILTDIPPHIEEMLKMIKVLDVATQQVMIEARIVEVTKGYAEQLGVQWGFTGAVGPQGVGRPKLLIAPPQNVTASNSAGAAAGTQLANNGGGFLVDLLPTGTTAGNFGGINLLVGNIFSGLNLDLQLKALETQSKGRVLASPKVTTADNREASISSGSRIPFQTTSNNGGTNIEFIEAELSLTVTPHITQDNFVYMNILTTRDAPDFSNTVNGQPVVNTREARTEVLVANGDTTVLGGVYENTTNDSEEAVPFFSRIPYVGWFFRNKSVSETISELLIFITPTVVNKY